MFNMNYDVFSPIPHCNQNTWNVFSMMNAVGLSFRIDMLEKYVSTEIGTHIGWDLGVLLALVSILIDFIIILWCFVGFWYLKLNFVYFCCLGKLPDWYDDTRRSNATEARFLNQFYFRQNNRSLDPFLVFDRARNFPSRRIFVSKIFQKIIQWPICAI